MQKIFLDCLLTFINFCISIICPILLLLGLFHQNLNGCDWLLEIDICNVMRQGKILYKMVDSLVVGGVRERRGGRCIKCSKK